MSVNPFHPDDAIRARFAELDAAIGSAIRLHAKAAIERSKSTLDANSGSILPAVEVEALCAAHGISTEELMLLCLKQAETVAQPPISKFFVGCVGLEAETGNLVFGGNLEFVGAHISNTVHGEGFVFTRAFSRGTSIKTIATGEAHPCAHCRQYLSEYAATANLTLIDPLGHRLKMADLYPWPFDPDYLGERGIVAGEERHPHLELAANGLSAQLTSILSDRGRRSYVPYGKSPAAIALQLDDGKVVGGSTIESVSFNPTISPLQAAMIDLFAHGYVATNIAAAAIAVRPGAEVNYALHAADLLGAIAPGVALTTVAWAE